MNIEPVIKRDKNGLARTRFCRETSDGGLDLNVDDIRYSLSPERIADGAARGATCGTSVGSVSQSSATSRTSSRAAGLPKSAAGFRRRDDSAWIIEA